MVKKKEEAPKKTVRGTSAKKSVKAKKTSVSKPKKAAVDKTERLLTAEGWKRRRLKEREEKGKAKK